MNMQKLMKTNNSWGLCVLRVVTGIIYMGHGWPKVTSLGSRADWLGSIGIPLPGVAEYLVAGFEFVGGAMIIAGVFTRFVSAGQAFAMFIAVTLVHLDNGAFGDGGYEWALLLMASSLALLSDGAGRWSIDRMLSNK